MCQHLCLLHACFFQTNEKNHYEQLFTGTWHSTHRHISFPWCSFDVCHVCFILFSSIFVFFCLLWNCLLSHFQNRHDRVVVLIFDCAMHKSTTHLHKNSNLLECFYVIFIHYFFNSTCDVQWLKNAVECLHSLALNIYPTTRFVFEWSDYPFQKTWRWISILFPKILRRFLK